MSSWQHIPPEGLWGAVVLSYKMLVGQSLRATSGSPPLEAHSAALRAIRKVSWWGTVEFKWSAGSSSSNALQMLSPHFDGCRTGVDEDSNSRGDQRAKQTTAQLSLLHLEPDISGRRWQREWESWLPVHQTAGLHCSWYPEAAGEGLHSQKQT